MGASEDYKELFNLIFEVVVLIDNSNGTILEANSAAVELYGYSYEELLKMRNTDLSAEPEKTKQATRGQLQKIPVRYHRKKNGTIIPVEINARHHIWHGINVHLCVIREISEQLATEAERHRSSEQRKLAEEALLAANEQLEQRVAERTQAAENSNKILNAIIACMSDWLWEVDAEGRYNYCSPKVEAFLGYTADEMVGKTPFDFMDPQEATRVAAIFDELVRNRLPIVNLENTAFAKDGRKVLLLTNGVPVLDEAGNLAGYRGVDSDITEKRVMEQQLFQARKMEAIGQLAGGIAHDFNNKLMVIHGNAALAHMEIDDTAKVLDCLQEISVAAEHSRQITRQLLGFSRKQEVKPVVLDINSCIEKTVKSLSRLIPDHIRVTFLSGADPLQVELDPVQLDQIIMNMALNARDAMPEGGLFTIETSTVTLDTKQSATSFAVASGDYVCITFRDTGAGMDQETLQRIFEPFFTTKEQGKGTGLGLATVHGIVRQNRGTIDVRSEPGQGTVFMICFPQHTAGRKER